MGKKRHEKKSGGKPIYSQRAKRERKKKNHGLGPPIGNIKNWI